MYSVIMGHLGSDAVAANSIANIVKNLVACFCNGLGSGGGIMVGNELGAGKLDTAKVYGGRYFIMSMDEMIKMPAVYIHYKKYKWVKDLTVKE